MSTELTTWDRADAAYARFIVEGNKFLAAGGNPLEIATLLDMSVEELLSVLEKGVRRVK